MSDSESDLSTPANLPSDAEIEYAVHKIVRAGVKEDGFSINVARSRVEKEVDLPNGFFKNDATWKQRSKEMIQTAVDEANAEDDSQPEQEETKSKPKPKAGTKRKSDDPPKAKPKRQKKSPSREVEDSEAEISAAEREASTSKAEKPKPKPKSTSKSEDTSALSSPPDDEPEPAVLQKQNGQVAPAFEDDDSDLSSVIDDPPPKKKRGSKAKSSASSSAIAKPKSNPQKPAKATDKPDLSPDEEEIKRLQSWLLKCGIRKLWHRELAPYSTSKEKIKHLKGMLEEVGMTGRFSAEKAKQIKESRELAAELEAAREFNEQWGHEDEESDEEDDGGKAKARVKEEKADVDAPVKRRPRGLVDFGDSGEDSD